MCAGDRAYVWKRFWGRIAVWKYTDTVYLQKCLAEL